MKKEKIKIFIIISVIVAILATIGVIGVFQYRKITLEKYNTDIQEQLTNLSHLENEVYFNPDYKKDISDIESESKIAFENKQLSKLSEVRNQATDLYDKISAEIDKYNKYYTLLTETVENSNNLKKTISQRLMILRNWILLKIRLKKLYQSQNIPNMKSYIIRCLSKIPYLKPISKNRYQRYITKSQMKKTLIFLFAVKRSRNSSSTKL